MKYIIHGATGAQGAPLFNQLIQSGKNAFAAVRNTDGLGNKPAIQVDLSSIDSLVSAYTDATGIFIHLPLADEASRLQYAHNIASAVKIAKPERIVISTSGWKLGVPGDENSALPTLIREVSNTQAKVAVIAPKLYLENLLLPIVMGPAKEEGVLAYPLRENYPVSWCSHLDIADVALRLLEDHSVTGIVEVGQLPAITGVQLAEAFSDHYQSKVTYQSLTPEIFGERLASLFGEAAAAEVVKGYQAKALTQDSAIATGNSAQHRLNIYPRSVQQWLKELNID